jgi:hypothetical protein
MTPIKDYPQCGSGNCLCALGNVTERWSASTEHVCTLTGQTDHQPSGAGFSGSPPISIESIASNSARPPSTVSINRPCGVVVSAQLSAGVRKPAPVLATASSTLSRSRVDHARRSSRVISNTSPALRAAIALVCKWAIEFQDKQHFNTLTFAVIVRRLRSVHPPDGTRGSLAAPDATPCEALGEGVDLIVMAPGKGE